MASTDTAGRDGLPATAPHQASAAPMIAGLLRTLAGAAPFPRRPAKDHLSGRIGVGSPGRGRR